MTNEIRNHIEELKINISRAKATIAQGWWDKGYVNNLKSYVASTEARVEELLVLEVK